MAFARFLLNILEELGDMWPRMPKSLIIDASMNVRLLNEYKAWWRKYENHQTEHSSTHKVVTKSL